MGYTGDSEGSVIRGFLGIYRLLVEDQMERTVEMTWKLGWLL